MMNSAVEPSNAFGSLEMDRRDQTCSVLRRSLEREKMRASRFEMTSSFLLASMILITGGVMILLVVYMTREAEPVARQFPLVEVVSGGGTASNGLSLEFELPEAVEAKSLDQPTVEDTLRVLTDAVSTVAGTVSQSQAVNESSGDGTSNTDARQAGPGDASDDTVPRFERWQIEFSAAGLQDYAKQLDHFGIELGLIGEQVDYAFDLSTVPKSRSQLLSIKDNRMYFAFTRSSPLQRYDALLLAQAKIRVDGRKQVKFISQDLEDQLAVIELEHAKTNGHADLRKVVKTVFASTPSGKSYEFKVVAQRYRR